MTAQAEFFPIATADLGRSRSPDSFELTDGAEIELRIAPVVKRLGDATVRMLAYNGSIPGPTLRVKQGSSLIVHVINDGDLETTVHWHGLRLANAFDGTTLVQKPILVGGRFTYRLTFPDPGVYWYHPHIREDYGQEMGLYGNIVVEPEDPAYWPAVDRELAVVLDDILVENGKVAPFRKSEVTFSAMGRYGNLLLVNGEVEPTLDARRGEVVRMYLTNTANSRVFDVAVPGARMKLVGGDSGRVEREEIVEHVRIAPSERAVVDVLFEQTGRLTLEHRTPGRTYALATIRVADELAEPSVARRFDVLRTSSEMLAARAHASRYLSTEPDKTLALVAEMDLGAPEAGAATGYACPMHPEVRSEGPERCPKCGMKLVPAHLVGAPAPMDHAHEHSGGGHSHDGGGIEWEDDMLDVNRETTPANTRWMLIDRATGAPAAGWRFRVGDQVKIRLVNEMDSDHPMHHPFHIHGAGRFLILSRDGAVEPNLVWKDTVLIPTGQTVDILLDVTHPGTWMAHCHIAEHHESGMMLTFEVDP